MMKNTGQILLNLRALIKDTLISTEQAARVSKDFVDINTISTILDQIVADIDRSNKKIIDLSIETIDKEGIQMTAKQAENLTKERLGNWKKL